LESAVQNLLDNGTASSATTAPITNLSAGVIREHIAVNSGGESPAAETT